MMYVSVLIYCGDGLLTLEEALNFIWQMDM